MTQPGAVVAIINFNTREELRDCLESLRPHLDRVIVFDNKSTDGSPEMMRVDYPEAALMENDENLGYGAAANRVFSDGCARSVEFLILSNSDVIFPPGSVDALVDDLVRHPEAGIAGPRLLNADGTLQRSCFPLPGSLRWVFDNDGVSAILAWIPGVRGQLFRLWEHDRDREVPWVKGAVLAIRRTAFEEVGGFDESFFMYYEETDLCLRMAKKGWRVRFTPASEVSHLGGVSTAKVRTAMAVELFISSMRFARRHYSVLHSMLLLGIWKAILLVRLIRDRLRLAMTSHTQERQPIKDDLQAWRRTLSWTFRDLEVPAANRKSPL